MSPTIQSWMEYRAVQDELSCWYDAIMAVDEELCECVVADELNTDMDARRFFDDWGTELWAAM